MLQAESREAKLPNAKFVIMSGLLLPGRSQFTSMTREINKQLKDYCDNLDYLYFVDCEKFTYDNANNKYYEDKFVADKIHLTHEARVQWGNDYIKPMLAQLDAKLNNS